TTSPPPATVMRSPMPSSPTPLPGSGTVALRQSRRDNRVPSSRGEPSMHTLSIPQSVLARVIERRGREHIHDDLDPAKTALVALCPMAEKIVPNINRLARAVREGGGTVVWIKTTFTDDALRSWSTYFDMVTPQHGAKRVQALTAGSEGHQLWAA